MFSIVRPALVASLATFCASLALTAGCERPGPAPPAVGNAPPAQAERVVVDAPRRKTLALTTTQPGRIEAFEQAPLAAKVAGYVESVQVDIGDTVAAGQPLLTLKVPELKDDERRHEALVVQARAELKQAEAAVVGAKAAVASAEALVAQAGAGQARVESEIERWQAEHRRIAELAEARTVTQKLADETLNQLNAAESARRETDAAVRSAEARRDEARANVVKAESDQGAAAARVQVAEAELAKARTMASYTEITAPFAGVVTRRNVDTGHLVSPGGAGAAPLLVICRTETVRVFVDVPELEAERVDAGKNGDPAVVAVQALGNLKRPARVTRAAWSLDPANRSLRTELDLENRDGVLRPGMFALVTITLDERPDVLCLPATAVVRDGADAYCFVVHGGKLVRRPITPGLRVGPDVEVTAGLQPTDSVVVAPSPALKDGQTVTAAKLEAK